MKFEPVNSIFRPADLLYWGDVFRVLGIRRFHSFWASLGIPETVIAHPEKAYGAAEYFWTSRLGGIRWQGRVLTGYVEPDFERKYELGVQTLLSQTFAMLSDSYGTEAASDLQTWASRNFIDKTAVRLWSTWDSLLSLDNENFSFGGVGSSLSRETLEKIRSTWGIHYPRNLRERIAALFHDVRGIPISGGEQMMIKLEVSQPGDMQEFDLESLIKIVLGRQRAFRFWADLASWAGLVEREALLWWAYDRAAAVGLPLKDVILPPDNIALQR